jgi:hypothetical protein
VGDGSPKPLAVVVAAAPPAAGPIPEALASSDAVLSTDQRLLLGRLVDLGNFHVERTLSDAPDAELVDIRNDVAVVLLADSKIRGFRLSSGEPLWISRSDAPCRNLLLAAGRVYSGCGNQVLSFSVTTGQQRVVDAGPNAGDPFLTESAAVVASRGGKGDIKLYKAGTDRLLARKVIPELSRAFHRYSLANPNPTSAGICALGLAADTETRMTYRAGCYDGRLVPQWTKSLPIAVPRDNVYDVRQLGPEFLVLDDQYCVLDPAKPPGPGHGLVLRWRDGSVSAFDDQTFATIEDVRGERRALASDAFERTGALPADDPGAFPFREAKIVSDHDRVFALVINRATALAGFDRATGKTLFLVPIAIGPVRQLDVVADMPVVRTRFADHWLVTVHDPSTGAIRYRDERPVSRAR